MAPLLYTEIDENQSTRSIVQETSRHRSNCLPAEIRARAIAHAAARNALPVAKRPPVRILATLAARPSWPANDSSNILCPFPAANMPGGKANGQPA